MERFKSERESEREGGRDRERSFQNLCFSRRRRLSKLCEGFFLAVERGGGQGGRRTRRMRNVASRVPRFTFLLCLSSGGRRRVSRKGVCLA